MIRRQKLLYRVDTLPGDVTRTFDLYGLVTQAATISDPYFTFLKIELV